MGGSSVRRTLLPARTSTSTRKAPVIETTEGDTPGIHAEHKGTGDITMDLLTRSGPQAGFIFTTSTTKGSGSQGVYANHEGTGDIHIFAPHTIVNTGIDA